MSRILIERDVETIIERELKNLGWIDLGDINERNIYKQNPKTSEQKKALGNLRPDFILYKKHSDQPLIVIEAKRPGQDLDKALLQGKEYAEKIGAPIVFAAVKRPEKTLYTFSNQPLYKDSFELRDFIKEDLAYEYFIKKTNSLDTIEKEVLASREKLIGLFKKYNNSFRSIGLRSGEERFTELANLIFLKLMSEKKESGIKEWKKWDSFKDVKGSDIIEKINDSLQSFKNFYKEDGIFENSKIKDSNNAFVLERIVRDLTPLKLEDSDSDIKGDAFEYFISHYGNSEKDLGEYFTPRPIINTMVEILDPKVKEKIYDPCCGTGGMLTSSFLYIQKTMENTQENIEKLSRKTFFGGEITSNARISKMNMIFAGDGHSNIKKQDSLLPENKIDADKNPDEWYDVIITNIPFGVKYDENDYSRYKGVYDIEIKNSEGLFLQHIIKALVPGGRTCVVVPEGVLFSNNLKKIREHLFEKCIVDLVVSLPQGAFLPYTGVKTNLLFFHKKEYLEKENQKKQTSF